MYKINVYVLQSMTTRGILEYEEFLLCVERFLSISARIHDGWSMHQVCA